MRSMLSLDLSIIGKYLRQELALALLLGVALSFAIGNVNVMSAAVCAMIPIALGQTAAMLDEQGGWERFRLALPLSRRDVVVGRYACGAVLTAVGIACGAVCTLVVMVAATAAGSLPNAAAITESFEMPTIACCLLASAACALLVLSVTLPLAFKMGMGAGQRFVPVVVVFVVVIVGVLMNNGSGVGINLEPLFAAAFATPASAVISALVAFAATLVVYAASCAVSCKLYRAREL